MNFGAGKYRSHGPYQGRLAGKDTRSVSREVESEYGVAFHFRISVDNLR